MHFRSRMILALSAVILVGALLVPALEAQEGTPPPPQTNMSEEDRPYARAIQLHNDNRRQEALNEYRNIAGRNRSNPELAADALYRGGIYALEQYPTNEVERRQGEEQHALIMWREILRNYPNTRAAAALTSSGTAGEPSRWATLSNTILKRNSPDVRYQIMHALVAITGSQPVFSYALALILLAFIVKIIVWPLTKKQYASMREMQRMQPMVKALQEKYKDAPPERRVEMNQKVMELYKEHGVNPFAGCLPMLVMLPFFFLVFTMIQLYELAFEKGMFLWVGSPLSQSETKLMGHNIFGRDLASPDVPLLALYAISNYVTMRLTPATDPQQQQQQNTMALMMSGFFFFMMLSGGWPSAFVLYWLALNLISIWQQYEYVYKPHVEKKRAGEGGGAAVELLPTDKSGPNKGAKTNGAGAPGESARPIAPGNQPTRVRPRKKRK